MHHMVLRDQRHMHHMVLRSKGRSDNWYGAHILSGTYRHASIPVADARVTQGTYVYLLTNSKLLE